MKCLHDFWIVLHTVIVSIIHIFNPLDLLLLLSPSLLEQRKGCLAPFSFDSQSYSTAARNTLLLIISSSSSSVVVAGQEW